MKLNRLLVVSILLLAIISIGAASAASDDTAADDAVGVTEELDIGASDVDEIATDGGDDGAVGSDANDDSKLAASAGEDILSAGTVTPKYTIDVTPNATDGGNNYVAQYGQIINVKGDYGNATGTVSVRFGFSGNYYYYNDIPLVDGKFSQDMTDYDRVRSNFQIQVTYSGDDYYKSATWSKNIHVQMQNVTANGAYYGLNPYMDVNLFDATGNVTFTLNGRNYTKKLENGKTTQEFTNYTFGKNTVKMYYEGDGVIKPIEKDFSFTVDVNVKAPTIYNYEPAIVRISFGYATGKVNITFKNESEVVDIVGGVATTELKNYSIGENTFEIAYLGDDTFNPFKTTAKLTVLDKENATIISSVYQTASQNFIFISVPYANGTINVTVNGKEEVWTLVNGTVKKDINASDKINELIVSYEGNVRLNPTTSSFYVNLTDYVVNSKTFRNYFDFSNGGRLYDFIEEGVTLDFQGVVYVNPNSENEMDIVISKPINIISSTNDAYIDLNTTAGTLLGEHPGSSFVVGREGSGSNISGIYLHNTELWISNTTNVVFDNISVVCQDKKIGSGNGVTSVRDNSTYVTIKNSYFYTSNNGGSSTFTFSWASYCVFDNNTVKAEGYVGNLLYLNVYNIQNLPGPTKISWGDILPAYPLNNHNVFSNNELFGKEGSAISVGIMVEGEYNVIANNTLHRTSISNSNGATGANNNIYYGNILEEGSSFTAQPYSIIYNNYLPGTKDFQVGANSVAYNNTIEGKMTVTAGAVAYNNTVGTTMSVAAGSTAYNNTVGSTMTVAANAVAYNNTVGALTISGANGVAYGNDVAGDITLTGSNAVAYNNTVTGTITGAGAGAKAIENTASSISLTGNDVVVAGNEVNTITLDGNNAVAHDNIVSGSITGAGAGANVYDNSANAISLTGDNVIVSDNNVTGTMSLTGVNATAAGNNVTGAVTISGDNAVVSNNFANKMTVGKNAEVNGNILSSTLSVGANSEVYNNIVSSSMTVAAGSIIHDNVANGNCVFNSNTVWYNNVITASLIRTMPNSKNVLIYNNILNVDTVQFMRSTGLNISNNIINGYLSLMASNGNSIVNNTINSITGQAILISSSNDNLIANNTLYALGVYGDAAISNPENNIVEGNKPVMPILTISVENITVGQPLFVVVSTSIDDYPNNSIIQIIVNGEIRDVPYDSSAYIKAAWSYFYDLPAGEYVITAISEAYGDYGESKNSTVVKVSKFNPALELNVADAVIGEDVNVTANIAGATGDVKFIIDGVENSVSLENGVAVYTIKDIAAGNHSIVAIYEGDASNEAISNYTAFTLAKAIPDVDVSYGTPAIGEDLVLNISVVNATGKVAVIFDDTDAVFVDLIKGSAQHTIEKITAGQHSIFVVYEGDAANEGTGFYDSFTLDKVTPNVDVAIGDLKLGEDATVTVTIVNATGKVNIIIDGVESAVDLVDGVATTAISKVTAGTHTVVANYAGDAKNNAAFGSASKTLTVLSTEITDVNVDGDLNINAVLKDSNGKGIENATIIYKVGSQNESNTTTGVNGTFTIKGEENAKVIISFAGSDLLFSTSTEISLSDVAPTRVASVITASDLTCNAVDMDAGEKGAIFKVVLKDVSGNLITNASVQIALNGAVYNVNTDKDGVASIQVNINKANTYTCAVSYLGDVKHDAAFTAVKVVVNKKATQLVAKKKTFKAKKKTKKYTATLKTTTVSLDGKTYFAAGKKVTLKVKGKTYSAKTNNNGKVTFKIKKLNKKGKYKAVINFAGDNTYKGVTKKVKIKVK